MTLVVVVVAADSAETDEADEMKLLNPQRVGGNEEAEGPCKTAA